MKKVLFIILYLSWSIAYSQDINNFASKTSFQLGSGFPGILLIDELTTDKRFNRVALPPVSFSLDYKIRPRLSLGIYGGIEYEKQSGTTIHFEGPNISTVSGIYLNYHIVKDNNLRLLDPYLGISLFYYSHEELMPLHVVPSLRIGCNVFSKNNIFGNLNIGTGVALGEVSLGYRL